MKLRRTILTALLGLGLIAALPLVAGAARNLVSTAGVLEAVDVSQQIVTVKSREIKVNPRSRLIGPGGERLGLDELAAFEGEDCQYTAYAVGRTLLLQDLQIGDPDRD